MICFADFGVSLRSPETTIDLRIFGLAVEHPVNAPCRFSKWWHRSGGTHGTHKRGSLEIDRASAFSDL
jgi:hypothetical protein